MRARWPRSTSKPRACSRASRARPARRASGCSAELADDGVELEELRTAVAEDRLALLPVERVLSGGGERLTARRGGRARRDRPGVPASATGARSGSRCADDDARVYTERDVEAAKRVRALLDAGMPGGGRARGRAPARDDDVAARRRQPAADRRRLHARGRHRVRRRQPLRRGRRGVHAADRRDARLRAAPPPARADPPRRVRRRRALRRPARPRPTRSPSASPTWSASPSSARRSSRRRSARSPAASASSPRPRSSRRCGW